jgi:hypothetical protein
MQSENLQLKDFDDETRNNFGKFFAQFAKQAVTE